MPTPRPTAKASELVDAVAVAVGVEDEAARARAVAPAVAVTVAVAAEALGLEEEEEEAEGSASPMPSGWAPGSWESRRRRPKLGRVKLEAQALPRSHSQTPEAGQGKMFMAVLR